MVSTKTLKSRAGIQSTAIPVVENTQGLRHSSSSSTANPAKRPVLKNKTIPQAPQALQEIYRGIPGSKKNAYLDAMILPQNSSDLSNANAKSGKQATCIDPKKISYQENSEQLLSELMSRGEFDLLGWLLENCPRIVDERGSLAIGYWDIFGKHGRPDIDSLAVALNRASHPFRKHLWVQPIPDISRSLLTKCEKFVSFITHLSSDRAEMLEHAAGNPNIKGLMIVISRPLDRFRLDDPDADPFRELTRCLPRMAHLENFSFVFSSPENCLPKVSRCLLGLLENARNLTHLDIKLYPECHDDLCRLLQCTPKLSGFVFRPPREIRSDSSDMTTLFASDKVLQTLNAAVLMSKSLQFLGFPDFHRLDNKDQVLHAIPDHSSLTMLNLGLPNEFSLESLNQIKAWLSTRSQIIQVFGPVDTSIDGHPHYPVDDVSIPFWKSNSRVLNERESVFLDICELLERNYHRTSSMQTFGASFAWMDNSKAWVHRSGTGFAGEDASKLLVDWIYRLSPTVDEFKRVMIPVILSLNELDREQPNDSGGRRRHLVREHAKIITNMNIRKRETRLTTATHSPVIMLTSSIVASTASQRESMAATDLPST